MHIQLWVTICDHRDKYVCESVKESVCNALRWNYLREIVSFITPPSFALATFRQHLKTGKASVVKCCCFLAPLRAYEGMSCCLKLLTTTLLLTSLTYSLSSTCLWPTSFSWQSSSGIEMQFLFEHVGTDDLREKVYEQVERTPGWHEAGIHWPFKLNWKLHFCAPFQVSLFSLLSVAVNNVDISSQQTCQVHHLWMTR